MPKRKHYFGWAGKEPHDPDDIPFSVIREVKESLPRSYDTRASWPTPIWDQANLGACLGFAASKDNFSDMLIQPAPDFRPSALFAYLIARMEGGTVKSDSGAYVRNVCKAMAKYGVASEESWPYDVRRFREMPPQSVWTEAAQRKIERYERVTQTLSDIKAAIYTKNGLIGGIYLTKTALAGADRDGLFRLPKRGDPIVGGHALWFCAFDDDRPYPGGTGCFGGDNSWGVGWGDRGRFWIPYPYVTNTQLAADFWVMYYQEPVAPPDPPVPPVPPPSPPVDWTKLLCSLWHLGRDAANKLIEQLPPGPWREAADYVANACDKVCPLPQHICGGSRGSRIAVSLGGGKWHDTTGEE